MKGRPINDWSTLPGANVEIRQQGKRSAAERWML